MRTVLLAAAIILGSCATGPQSDEAQGNVTNHEAAGNLQSLAPVECKNLNELDNNSTPADLFPGVEDCMKKKDYDRAALLYALALAYGRVDQLRVQDTSAHEAIGALQYKHLGGFNELEATQLQKSVEATATDEQRRAGMCLDMRTLGPPAYYPTYMIQHGLGAFTGRNQTEPIKTDFDMSSNWEQTLIEYIHCP